MSEITEIWSPVVGYESLYEVSSFGNIKSLNRLTNNQYKAYFLKGKQLSPATDKGGYKYVCLTDLNKKSKFKYVHRLMAESFLKPIPGKEFVNHIDGDKSNNYISNLEYVSKSENTIHAYSIGKMGVGINVRAGSNNSHSVFTESDVMKIRNLHSKGENCFRLSKQFNVNNSTISRIIKRETWKHI